MEDFRKRNAALERSREKPFDGFGWLTTGLLRAFDEGLLVWLAMSPSDCGSTVLTTFGSNG